MNIALSSPLLHAARRPMPLSSAWTMPCSCPSPHPPCPQAYASLKYMDDVLGRLFDHLEATGMYKNTYVFYTRQAGGGCWGWGWTGHWLWVLAVWVLALFGCWRCFSVGSGCWLGYGFVWRCEGSC